MRCRTFLILISKLPNETGTVGVKANRSFCFNEYDASGRTTKVTSKDASDKEIANVSYAYDAFDNMTEIVRGDGMKYVLAYNAFHDLESIGVDGKTEKLVRYTYKPGNGRLKAITYANGDNMQATYNSAGQMVAEKWYDKNNTMTAHYKYVYDGQGNIVRSVDMVQKKEYNYQYEEGKLYRATESSVNLSNGVVVSKTLVNTIRYSYDREDRLTKKVITPASGAEQTVYYENGDGSNTVMRFTAGGRTVTSHSKTDSLGRKVFDELQLGTGFVFRQFAYHAGEVTQEHKDHALCKSSPTTQLVSQIVFSGGRTISYEYDAEERITQVDDSVEGITTYTYDALGQLVTETVNGITTKFEYDNYGNIKAKGVVDETGEIAEATKITYAYDDEHWHDLLTAYNGQSITYDAQGNPTSYLGHELTWEKGRQLKSFDGNTYTYNANGIRTSKTVNGVKHTYILDGTKILRETWNGNTLIPLYDNEDSVCGIVYNNEPFYFQKNLQGDVIAIVNKDAEVVARYTYDAWGVCTTQSDSSGCAIATLNPFRYRSYYYDEELALYYLQSRYYNPEIGRLLNSDEAMITYFQNDRQSLNLFVYTYNTLVIFKDVMGYSATLAVGGVVISISSLLVYILQVAAIISVLALLLDKNFRNKLADAATKVWSYAINTVDYLTTAINEVVVIAKRSRRYSGNEDHHIVAQTDHRAEWSRKLINKYGLKTWHQYNVVTIKKTLHKHLHTSAYHYGVYLVLKGLEIKGRNKSQRRIYILSGLLLIGVLLKAASNAIP